MRNKGDKVAFRLDGSWYGEGVIYDRVLGTTNLIVGLSTKCKEHKIGDHIIVEEDEFCEFKSHVPRMVCDVCSGDSFHVLFMSGGNKSFQCANPICKETFCQDAGCDRCGTQDRVMGEKVCKDCKE